MPLKDLIDHALNLSNEEKIKLIASILGTEPVIDNSATSWELVFYTGLYKDEDGMIVEV